VTILVHPSLSWFVCGAFCEFFVALALNGIVVLAWQHFSMNFVLYISKCSSQMSKVIDMHDFFKRCHRIDAAYAAASQRYGCPAGASQTKEELFSKALSSWIYPQSTLPTPIISAVASSKAKTGNYPYNCFLFCGFMIFSSELHSSLYSAACSISVRFIHQFLSVNFIFLEPKMKANY
jgi:hypothetical protein